MNPWIVGVGVTVVGGLILYYGFGIGRKTKEQPKRIGIINRGRNNTFLNNTFEGLDIGIKDEGEETIARGNEFK